MTNRLKWMLILLSIINWEASTWSISLTCFFVNFCCFNNSSILALIWECLENTTPPIRNESIRRSELVPSSIDVSDGWTYSEVQRWPRITAINCTNTEWFNYTNQKWKVKLAITKKSERKKPEGYRDQSLISGCISHLHQSVTTIKLNKDSKEIFFPLKLLQRW